MPETSAQRALMRTVGADLRALRVAAGLTVRDLAERVGLRSHSSLTLFENGKRLPSEEIAQRILAVVTDDADVRTAIITRIRESAGPGRIDTGFPGVGGVMAELVTYERDASRITNVSLGLIPGLLQTADYARAVMVGQPDMESRVTLRIGRREVLTRKRSPAELVALIDSEVLVRPIGGPQVMVDQLRFLLEMAALPNVTIRLISSTRAGWHPGLCGPFELIEFPRATPVLLLEHYRSSAFLWDHEEVQWFKSAAEQISAVAMTPAESAEAIAYLISGYDER